MARPRNVKPQSNSWSIHSENLTKMITEKQEMYAPVKRLSLCEYLWSKALESSPEAEGTASRIVLT